MKRASINNESLHELIPTSLIDIAEEIVDICDDTDEGHEDEELFNACNDTLIYTKEQWKIIETYSTPNDPLPFYQALECFYSDLSSVVEWNDIDG